jgi:2-polyprenyl-3-methyl-5-hydroxy-6-metoxy-1,4-benzoquinol methylase
MNNEHLEMKRYYLEWWENPRDPRDVVFRRLNRLVCRRIPPGQGKTALDVGSGKGKIVSFLVNRGYRVTAVELNEKFAERLRKEYPTVEVIEGDINSVVIQQRFDIVTAIEFAQNLEKEALRRFVSKMRDLTGHLVLTISNADSVHGLWTAKRGFQKWFVHTYSPAEIEQMLVQFSFEIAYTRGVGLLTPITLMPEFRWKLLPIWIARLINPIGDVIFPKICHLYYLEAYGHKDGAR